MGTGESLFVCPPHVPPRDAWKVNPDTLRKFYAPTDDRGFVLPDATVEVVRALFEDEYEWPIDPKHQAMRPDVHHFHWFARNYDPSRFQGRTIPHQFRELPSVKGIVPRQFHNVIHEVTLPPAMPRYIDMLRHVRAYALARRAFDSAIRTVEAQARFNEYQTIIAADDATANGILISAFDRQFRGYRMHVEQLVGAAGLQALELDDPKFSKRKPHEVARFIGKQVIMSQRSYVSQFKMAA